MNNASVTLIGSDQTILLWAAIITIVAISVTLEQRYKWASSIGSCVLCIFFGFVFANLKIIPHSAPVFSSIGSVILICSLPLLLFKVDIKEILRSSGKLFILFWFAAAGTIVGCLAMWGAFGWLENSEYLITLIGAGHIGGTVNCIAINNIFALPKSVFDAYLVVGNFCVGVTILATSLAGKTNFIRKSFSHPHIDEFESAANQEELAKTGTTLAGAFWGGKEIGLKDIATAFALTFVIVGVSSTIAGKVVALNPPGILKQLFGSVYLIMTIMTATLATIFSKFFGSIRGTMELGNFGLLMWFCTIGISGDMIQIIKYGVICAFFFFVIALFNFAGAWIGGKLIKASWEEVAIVNQATVGGPPTAASMAVSFGWAKLVVPGLLIGLWGYCMGTYIGILIGNILGVPGAL